MEGLPTPGSVVEPIVPAATAPVAPATTPTEDPAAQPAAPAASPAPEPGALGTEANPVVVPRGTQDAFKKIADAGYKPEDIEAYLATVPDEATRQHLKDSLEGKQVYLKEGVTSFDELDPFTEDELKDVEALTKDPELLVARIERMNKEFLELADEVEKAKNSVPEPLQRIMTHPLVKLAVDEMEAGQDFAMQYFDGDKFMNLANQALESGDVESIKALVAQIPETMSEILKIAIAKTKEEQVAALEQERVEAAMKLELETGLTRVSLLPDFKSSEPEMKDGKPNLNHPGVAFADWLIRGLADGKLNLDAINYQGGFDKVAMNWLANQRGGTGRLVAEARQSSAASWREKMLRSRQSALAPAQAKTLTVGTGGVQSPLMHGVDISLALRDPGYAERVTYGLNDKQLAEVNSALIAAAQGGLTNLR